MTTVQGALLVALAVSVECFEGCGGQVSSTHSNSDGLKDAAVGGAAAVRRDSGSAGRLVDSGTPDVSVAQSEASVAPDAGVPVADGGSPFQFCSYEAGVFESDAGAGARCAPPVVAPVAIDDLVLPMSDCRSSSFDAGSSAPWVRCMPANGPTISDAVFVPPNDVVVAGTAIGPWDLGCGRLPQGTIAFAARYDSTGACVWSTALATVADFSKSSGGAYSVSADAAGNTVVTGTRSGPVTLGGRKLDGVLNYHRGFVARLDAAGKVEWALDVQPNLERDASPGVIATMDASGDAYVVGHAGPSFGIGGCAFTAPAFDGAYLARLDRTGHVVWLRSLSEFELGALAVANGRVVLVGSEGIDLYVRSFNTSGQELWVRRFPLTGQGILRGVAIAPDWRIATTGIALGDLTIGGTTLHGGGFAGDPVFIVLDGTGQVLQDRIFNQTGIPDARYLGGAAAEGLGIAFGPNGDIFTVGSFTNSINFGGGPLGISGATSQGFAVVFDSNLQCLRSRAFAGYPDSVKLGCDGALYVAAAGFVARGF